MKTFALSPLAGPVLFVLKSVLLARTRRAQRVNCFQIAAIDIPRLRTMSRARDVRRGLIPSFCRSFRAGGIGLAVMGDRESQP